MTLRIFVFDTISVTDVVVKTAASLPAYAGVFMMKEPRKVEQVSPILRANAPNAAGNFVKTEAPAAVGAF